MCHAISLVQTTPKWLPNVLLPLSYFPEFHMSLDAELHGFLVQRPELGGQELSGHSEDFPARQES